MAKLAPSLLSANFADLKEDIKKIEIGGADYLHLDVMDGNYVPNISFGTPIIKSIRNISNLKFDVHLMIEKPERYIEDFVKAGADIITIHQEASIHLHRTIQEIKKHGIKAGVSLNPSTNLDTLKYVLKDLDLVLIMSVNPGFGGQSFIPEMREKILELRKLIDEINPNIILEVDGGIKLDNVKEIKDLGVDLIVVGSAIFGTEDIVKTTKEFKDLIK